MLPTYMHKYFTVVHTVIRYLVSIKKLYRQMALIIIGSLIESQI